MISYHSKISLTSPSSELGCELSSELEYDPPSNEREKISDANNACPFFLILKPNLHIIWNVLGALNHHPNHEVRQGTHSNHHYPHHSNCSRPHHHKNHEHHLSSSSLWWKRHEWCFHFHSCGRTFTTRATSFILWPVHYHRNVLYISLHREYQSRSIYNTTVGATFICSLIY